MRNVPNLSSNSMPILTKRLQNKASQSSSKIHIAAMAFDHRGRFIAQKFNSFRTGLSDRKGGGMHAEAALIRQYGNKIKTILLCRVGHGGDFRKIRPCAACSAMAEKVGIKIITIDECREDNPDNVPDNYYED